MNVRYTVGFIWLFVIAGMLLTSCQVLKIPLPGQQAEPKAPYCEVIFVLPPPPSLPGVPQLTPEQAADRNVSDKILVDYIGTIRRINRDWQTRVARAYSEYRKACQ